jgi:hypothetical protein
MIPKTKAAAMHNREHIWEHDLKKGDKNGPMPVATGTR